MSEDTANADARHSDQDGEQAVDLDIMSPEPREVEGILISPITLGRLGSFARAVRQLDIQMDQEIDMLALAENNSDAVASLLVAGLDLTRSQVESFGIDKSAELMVAVLEVNASFFALSLAPKIEGWLGRISKTFGLSLPANWLAQGMNTLQ